MHSNGAGTSAERPSAFDSPEEVELAALLEKCLAEAEAGRSVEVEALCAARPHLAERLRTCLHVLAWAEGMDSARPRLAGSIAEPLPSGPTDESPARREGPGAEIGRYTLCEPIGEGGMGVVYRAEQTRPVRRSVALKLIKPGMDTAQVLARFEVERQALALMEHPNIARVVDVGATGAGCPYFVMELVQGVPITTYCDTARLTTRERVALFLPVCYAIQHAHQKGIIHRDIKPSNVLVATSDGKPVVKVIDFGVAKAIDQRLVEQNLSTTHGAVVGTLEYMSPEQAELNGLDVDTRTDLYSLGVLLYELLTGTTPLKRETVRQCGYLDALRRIKDEDPPTPSTRLCDSVERAPELAALRRAEPARLMKQLRGELDWIVMKALDKDRTRRYATAEALARDIERYLAEEPVEAGPPSVWYRVAKFTRRNWLVLRVAAAVALTLVTATVVSVWQAAEARRARELTAQAQARLSRQRDAGRRLRYLSDVRLADGLAREGHRARALELLRGHVPAAGEEDLRNFAWHYVARLCNVERRVLRGHSGAVYHAEFSSDGRTVVTCGRDGTIRFWDVASGKPLRTIAAGQDEVNWAQFTPDGRTLATGGDDGTIKFWNATTGVPEATLRAHQGDVMYVGFVPGSDRFVTAGRKDCAVKLWDRSTLELVAEWHAPYTLLEGAAITPDGSMVATFGFGASADLWSLRAPGKSLARIEHLGSLRGAAFAPDGRQLALVGDTHNVRLLLIQQGRVAGEVFRKGDTGDTQAVAYLRDGLVVASAGDDGAVRLWDATTSELITTLLGHGDKIWGLTASPDGSLLASASSDGTVRLWETWSALGEIALRPAAGMRTGTVAFTPDDRTLVAVETVAEQEDESAKHGHYVRARLEFCGFDALTGRTRFSRRATGLENLWCLHTLLAGDGRYALTLSVYGDSTVWDVATARPVARHRGRILVDSLSRSVGDRSRESAPDGLTEFPNAVSWPILRGVVAANSLVLSPDGDTVAASMAENQLVLCDIRPRRVRATRTLDDINPHALAFAPDGRTVAVGSTSGVIHLFGTEHLEAQGALVGHTDSVATLAFSPDGKLLASGSNGGTVKLWDVTARQVVVTLWRKFGTLLDIRFAHNGRALALWGDHVVPPGMPHLHLLPTALPADPEPGSAR